MIGKLFIVGVGPGHHDHMTDRARWAIKQSDTIVGYETYVNLVKDLISGKDVYRYAMTQEVELCSSVHRLGTLPGIPYLNEGWNPSLNRLLFLNS